MSPSSINFRDLDVSEEHRSVLWKNVLKFGFIWCFLKIRFGLCILGRNSTEVTLCSPQCIRKHKALVNSKLLVLALIIRLRWCFPGFSTEMYSFPFVINKYLVGTYWDYVSFLFFVKLPLTSLASVGDSCLKQLLLWWWPYDDFLLHV